MASASRTDEVTCKLIEIRDDESIQAILEGCKSKRSVDNTNTFIRDTILSRKFINKCSRQLSRDTAHAHISVPCECAALIV